MDNTKNENKVPKLYVLQIIFSTTLVHFLQLCISFNFCLYYYEYYNSYHDFHHLCGYYISYGYYNYRFSGMVASLKP